MASTKLHLVALTAARKKRVSERKLRLSRRLLKRGNPFFVPPISLRAYGFV
jgi:hypothetical protein